MSYGAGPSYQVSYSSSSSSSDESYHEDPAPEFDMQMQDRVSMESHHATTKNDGATILLNAISECWIMGWNLFWMGKLH